MLPGALLAGIFSLFFLHIILTTALDNFSGQNIESVERFLTPGAIGGMFVWAGSRIAPEFKIVTAVALFGLWLFLVGGFVFLTLYGANWMGGQLYFRAGGWSTLMAVVGAIAGLYFVWKEQKERKP